MKTYGQYSYTLKSIEQALYKAGNDKELTNQELTALRIAIFDLVNINNLRSELHTLQLKEY